MQQEQPEKPESSDAKRRRVALAWLLILVVLGVAGYLLKRAIDIYTHSVPAWDIQAVWFPVELIPGLAICAGALTGAIQLFRRGRRPAA